MPPQPPPPPPPPAWCPKQNGRHAQSRVGPAKMASTQLRQTSDPRTAGWGRRRALRLRGVWGGALGRRRGLSKGGGCVTLRPAAGGAWPVRAVSARGCSRSRQGGCNLDRREHFDLGEKDVCLSSRRPAQAKGDHLQLCTLDLPRCFFPRTWAPMLDAGSLRVVESPRRPSQGLGDWSCASHQCRCLFFSS